MIRITRWNALDSGRRTWNRTWSRTTSWTRSADTDAGCIKGPTLTEFWCPFLSDRSAVWRRMWTVMITSTGLPWLLWWMSMKEKVRNLRELNWFEFMSHAICFNQIGDQCPMYFDDGSNPYREEEERIITFFKGNDASSLKVMSTLFLILPVVFNIL